MVVASKEREEGDSEVAEAGIEEEEDKDEAAQDDGVPLDGASDAALACNGVSSSSTSPKPARNVRTDSRPCQSQR